MQIVLKSDEMVELIYDNPKTETFAEFTLMNGDAGMSESEIIDAFMQTVETFDDRQGITLPADLLIMLSDEELDLFLLCAYNEEYFQAIEEMIYVVKEDTTVVDKYGMQYSVDYVGKSRSVLTYESITGLSMLRVANDLIEDGVVDFRDDLGC